MDKRPGERNTSRPLRKASPLFPSRPAALHVLQDQEKKIEQLQAKLHTATEQIMDHEEELDGVTKEYALKEHQMSRDIQSQSERLEQGAKELSAMTEQLEALKGTFAEYQRDSEKRDKVFNPQRPRPPEFRTVAGGVEYRVVHLVSGGGGDASCARATHGVVGRNGTTRGGVRHLGLTHTETQRRRLWTTGGGSCMGSKNRQTTPATTSTTPGTPTIGHANAQTAPATLSTAPGHQLRGSANAETTPAGAPAAAADRTQRPDATCEGKSG